MEQKIPHPQRSWVLLAPSPTRVLVLDLDGTLLRTDTFHEMMALVLHKKPWKFLWLPLWFWKGRAYAKVRLAELAPLSPALLPYNPAVVIFAETEVRRGRPLVLATGSPQKVAESIAGHFGFFQEVIGSDECINMTGLQKQKALVKRFGAYGFDYAGDSLVDIHVWQQAAKAIVVAPKRGVLDRVQSLKEGHEIQYFPREKKQHIALLQALRIPFWSLNLWAPSWPLCIAWSCLMSGLLIAGDLLCLSRERKNGSRPSIFAQGNLHLITAFLLCGFLVPLSVLFFILALPQTGVWILAVVALFMGMDMATRRLFCVLRWTILVGIQLLFLVLIRG